MAALRAQLDEKQKELDALQEAAMLGQAEMEVDEEERVAHKKATAIRRLSDMQLYDAGDVISGSNGEATDTEMDSGGESDSDNMEAGESESESDEPVSKTKKAPQKGRKGVSLAFNESLIIPFTLFNRRRRKWEERICGKP
jgi:hypothetical protein